MNYDYSYYLGPNYNETQKLPLQASCIVPSHNSHNDHWVLLKHYMPNFLAANVVKGAIKFWMEMAGVIFFDRNETDEVKRL